MFFFLIFQACSDTSSDTNSSADTPLEDTASTEASEPLLTEWTVEKYNTIRMQMAKGICTQILNCCDATSQEQYFANYANHTALSEYQSLLPPQATLSEEECPQLIAEMMDKTWLGSWNEVLTKGEVVFEESAFASCLNELETASCGEELTEALFDGTCFGFRAPEGGEKQRSYLSRTHTSGMSCQPIADGLGGLYYGSCDPTESFCCIASENGCDPFPTLSDVGTCQSSSKEGESCSIEEPIQLCSTGFDCDYTSNTCIRPNTQLLQQGDVCYHPSTYEVLGDCENSWCDLFGSSQCEPLKTEGEECIFPESCASQYCDHDTSTCSANQFCAN